MPDLHIDEAEFHTTWVPKKSPAANPRKTQAESEKMLKKNHLKSGQAQKQYKFLLLQTTNFQATKQIFIKRNHLDLKIFL